MNQLLMRSFWLVVSVCMSASALAQESCAPEPDISSVLKPLPNNSIKKGTASSYPKKSPLRQPKQISTKLYPAKVLKLKGDVILVSRAGQLVNRPLIIGSELLLDDVVETGRQSFVTIVLGSGVISVLPSNAKVALKQASASVARYELLQGSIENRVVKKPNAKRSTFEITVPNGVLGVRGTHFTVEYDLGRGDSGVSVADGVVVVRPVLSCSRSLVVTDNHSARIGPTFNPTSDIQKLLVAPIWTNVRAQRSNDFSFEVSTVEGAVKYVAQVARDAKFLDVVAEQDSPDQGGRVVVPGRDLPDGFYYVRLAALDQRGLRGLTQTYLFLKNTKNITDK
ncbi:MAG: hypothetical protein H6R05_1716 [Burkholderiaceae bacterium]|nr:hypothetical protein [Burkholderiaceae bacterium]